jgi:hypothetical protein
LLNTLEAKAKAEAKAKVEAKNNALWAQVAKLLQLCDKGRKEQCLEKMPTLVTRAMSDLSI